MLLFIQDPTRNEPDPGNRVFGVSPEWHWANGNATGAGANPLNQYGSISYPNVTNPVVPTYDFDGNMLSGPVAGAAGSSVGVPVPANAQLTWDAENRLIKAVVGGTTVNYAYDHLSRLISRSVGVSLTSSTHYLYDGWNRIAEYSGTTLEKSYLWGMDISGSMQGAGGVGGLLAIVDAPGGARHYPTYDGNVSGVSPRIATFESERLRLDLLSGVSPRIATFKSDRLPPGLLLNSLQIVAPPRLSIPLRAVTRAARLRGHVTCAV